MKRRQQQQECLTLLIVRRETPQESRRARGNPLVGGVGGRSRGGVFLVDGGVDHGDATGGAYGRLAAGSSCERGVGKGGNVGCDAVCDFGILGGARRAGLAK